MKAVIKVIKAGKQKGNFNFKLLADNGEPIDPRQPYNAKQSLIKTLKKFFPNFEIVDMSIKPKSKK